MTREELFTEIIDTFQDLLNFVHMNNEKSKEIFTEQQLDLVEEFWSYYDDYKDATYEELEDWFYQHHEMHYMY
ncbi:hypothetical protein SAMN05421824_0962 [Hyunsoonleella jejuensis]|uniref:Uncharacterized protein n=1 Tax=Hyunsoonleella jejuensis TaxID=419940 RepID=A0A1H9CNN3_9FLAO|nr:hypothetical protein [Hyunsoonleella jejuensis]SEQ02806.1 hypothetical protein SAMN05421824_0962 [Hyunsoonleella jejuensis]